MTPRHLSCRPSSLNCRARILAAAAAMALGSGAVHAGTSSNTSGQSTQNGANPAVTISLSGSTAMRNFTTSPGFTYLDPGSTITLGNGTNGAPVTYIAPNSSSTQVQLASGDFTAADSPQPLSPSSPSTAVTQNQSAIRLEWHEQGSVEGILEMVNDQVGYAGGLSGTPLIDPSIRNPIFNGGNAFSNPYWVNRNVFNGTTTGKSVGTTVGSGNTINGLFLANSDYNTYNTAVSNPGGSNFTYNAATGANLQGGANRVQMAISDVNAVQGFSIGGSSATGSLNSTPQIAGYGKGNNNVGLNAAPLVLPTNVLVTPGSSFQLRDATLLNMPANVIDPQTGQNYATGAWNNAGLGNLISTRVAVTATTFAANPGTGLTKLNSTDAQWLQTTGRLQNGADFNVTTRDVGSGTRNVAANNTGIDPSFAVGENDAGNSYVNTVGSGIDAQSQLQIGGATNGPGAGVTGALTAPLFSNKSTGGLLRSTVQNSRMAIGTLGMSDAIGTAKNGTSTPIRVLAYADTAGQGAGAAYVLPSASTITDGTYVIYQNEQYVVVQAPDANYGTANYDIKGDNANHDVATIRNNVLSAVTNFPATSVANPADQLLAASFILPQMMQVEKSVDGVNQSTANPIYNSTLRTEFLASSYAANFNPADPSSVTSGNNAYYGQAGTNVQNMAQSEHIYITPNNYLFGNFNQNGTRDYSAVQTALGAAKALYNNSMTASDPNHGTSMFTGDSNATPITDPGLPGPLASMLGQRGFNSSGVPIAAAAGASKGDLIVMGDYNGDGAFNGADLYALAHGAALADNASSTTLTSASGATFADQVRNGVLVKNAALNYMQANTADAQYDGSGHPLNASAYLRETASRNPTNDPMGTNAFNIYDVNGDGKIDYNDAAVIAHFEGQSYTNLSQQLAATINTNGTVHPGTQKPFNLVDAQLIDGESAISDADLKQFMTANPNAVIPGDLNLDGQVNSNDLQILLFHLNRPGTYAQGDINFDGQVNSNDLQIMLFHLNTSLVAPALLAEAEAAVPEPGVVGTLAVGLLAIGLRRRKA